MIYKNALELIGNTPMVSLESIGFENVYVKLEKYNPGGSIKDRIALSMIEGAEKRGILKKGSIIVEATSGNTGIGLAMAGNLKGYKVVIIMPETMSLERRQLVKAFGAELILTEGLKGMNGSIEKLEKLLKENKNYVNLGQFENLDNPKVHYEKTGPEIYKEVPNVDIVIAGIGSGGTISGVGKFLKEKNENLKVVGIEPASSPLITEHYAGPHKIQGIGANFIPKNYDEKIVDEVITVSDEDSFEMVRLLASNLGLLVGISSGANVFGAIELSKKYPDKKIVTVAPDGVDKYMSMGIF
ncbi:MAG: cysteine synthase A [Clostridiales bacterium]|uniref:cysteine synthase A n=1 Tax=Terrisporobacter sp. TaxID=1965305 RepID=UPI002A431C03|nr:cysteine synthase A [Terrisporobacter sp.]MCI6456349.1 cysteine synthase A [Clostridium sp.]MDD5878543.1 cysteine synthase A [Clostridiales bacterium]MCI7207359.1 cysteine synthase A [Clostridium sp.]MDD7754816.1 cysteine synthase A [Clostridiales bacterium]MDY4135264.1 cysteine synthase A [Terrisporobacter sp.]